MPAVDLDAPSRAVQLSVDDALVAVKEFGRGQQLQTLLVGLAWVLAALHTLAAVVFATLDPLRRVDHGAFCRSPEDEACRAALAGGRLCDLPRDAWQWRAPGASLVSDFDLICGKRWLLYLQTSLFFLSVLAGCLLWQLNSERYGRRRLLYSGAVLSGLASIMASTAPSLPAYIAFRCASGVGVGGMGVAAFALAADLAGPSWRGWAGLLLNHAFSAGACAATLLAWWVPSWRLLSLLAGALSLAYTATASFVVESPHWLLLRGRKGEATAELARVAMANGARPPEHPLADPTALLGNTQRGLRDVLASAALRQRLALVGAAWFAAGAGYWGLLLLADGISSGARGTDDSVHITLLSAFAYEVPGIAAAGLAVERAGRKATTIAALLEAGACMVVAAVARGTARRALYVAARFGLAAACASLYLHTSELFPSAVREQGLGAANVMARAGAALTPLFAFLQSSLGSSFVPLLVLGCLTLAAAFFTLGLPETLGEAAPATIQDLHLQMSLRRKRHSWRHALAGVASVLRPGGSPPSRTASATLETSAALGSARAMSP